MDTQKYIPRSKRCRKERPKTNYSKFIVALVILMNAAFAVVVLFIFFRIGTEPTALIAAWFGFTTAELWALAGIKKKEVEEGKNDARSNY